MLSTRPHDTYAAQLRAAFDEGYRAFGRSHGNNPYQRGEARHDAWENGHSAAYADFQDRDRY